MGPFPNSENYEFILVAVDPVSNWVEAKPYRSTTTRHAEQMTHENIFPRFGVPGLVIGAPISLTPENI